MNRLTEIGHVLSKIKEFTGLTITEIAKELHTSQSFISQVMYGFCKISKTLAYNLFSTYYLSQDLLNENDLKLIVKSYFNESVAERLEKSDILPSQFLYVVFGS